MKKLGDVVYKIECAVAGAAFVIMVVVNVFNVLMRYITSSSFSWAEEISYLSFNWAVFFGICIVYRNQGLIAIDVLVNRLPEKAQSVVQTLTFFAVGLTNVFLVIWGYQLAAAGWLRTTPALEIPYFFMYIEIPITCAILMVYSFRNCWICLRGGKVESASLEEQV